MRLDDYLYMIRLVIFIIGYYWWFLPWHAALLVWQMFLKACNPSQKLGATGPWPILLFEQVLRFPNAWFVSFVPKTGETDPCQTMLFHIDAVHKSYHKRHGFSMIRHRGPMQRRETCHKRDVHPAIEIDVLGFATNQSSSWGSWWFDVICREWAWWSHGMGDSCRSRSGVDALDWTSCLGQKWSPSSWYTGPTSDI